MISPRQLPHRRRTHLAIHAAVALLALAACRGKSDDKNGNKQGDEPPAPEQSTPASSSPADTFGMMSALLAGQPDEPGPYDELDESPGLASGDDRVAMIELGGAISERRSFSFTGGFEGLELRVLLDKLEEVTARDDVTALLIRWDELSIEPALAEELRGGLEALAAAHPDKPIGCHAEAVSTYTYWVMTACSTIALTPGGELSIPGVAAVPMHLKGLLDRLGIQADFLHVGDYKGAAEPLTLDAPSAESRETVAMILDQAFAGLVSAISEGRHIDEATARALIDRAMLKAPEALAAKLVDAVQPFDAFRAGLGPSWERVKLGDGDNPSQRIFEMLGLRPVKRPRGDRVALVYAVGNVVDGEGSASEEIASRTVVAALEALGRDEEVKAVVLRVSSPGGSALASEVIWGAIKRLEATKPVIVSMGAVAASGGYYISAPATRIFALENTLTGSIGVVGGKLATAGGLAKLGIKTYPTGRGKHALLFASPQPWTGDERQVVFASMKAVYDQFAARVREGRGDISDELMQGRVWTGKRALEHKLVDEIGGLDRALAFARAEAKLGDSAPIEVYPPAPTLRDMIGSLGVSARARLVTELVTEPLARLGGESLGDLGPILSRSLELVAGFATQPIQTALILPLVLR